MARWFGQSWGAPVCDPGHHAPTPVGLLCAGCDRQVIDGDQGMLVPYASDPPSILAYHLKCFLQMVLGEGLGDRMSL